MSQRDVDYVILTIKDLFEDRIEGNARMQKWGI